MCPAGNHLGSGRVNVCPYRRESVDSAQSAVARLPPLARGRRQCKSRAMAAPERAPKVESSGNQPPFQPYVPDESTMAEFTPKAIVIGVVFGIIFGAATVYLALKAGLTVSASIPIAVLAISLLKK